MGKLNMKLMKGVAETEQQIKKEKQPDFKTGKAVAKDGDTEKLNEKPQNLQTALKHSKARKNTKKSEKTENKPNTKPQKQVFSFRAAVSDIAIWKAYATASGRTMEYIGNAAMNEYLRRHKLNDAQIAVFEALKVLKERE